MSMEINFIGITAALTAFLGIWLGHISVRIIERSVVQLWIPIALAIVLSLSLEAVSLSFYHRLLSTITGIFGITVLWDAFELVRQEKRVKKGHAPANQNNPRHAAFLTEADSNATHLDLLNRDPVGRPVDTSEAIQMVTKR